MSGDNVIKGGLVVGLLSMSVAAQGAPSLKPQCVAQLQRDMDEIASQPLFTQARLGSPFNPFKPPNRFTPRTPSAISCPRLPPR